MASHIKCPKCKEYTLHRSRKKHKLEGLFKKILQSKIYRCHHCQWRGYISNRRVRGKKSLFKELLFYVGVAIISFFAASMLWMSIK